MTPEELIAIGQQLRQVRESQGLSLARIAEATKIRAKFLEAIELGERDDSLNDLQWRGFVRNYAAYLNLDLEAMLWTYRQNLLSTPKPGFRLFSKPAPTPPPSLPIIPIRGTSLSPTPAGGVPRVQRPITTSTQEMREVAAQARHDQLRGILLGVGLTLAVLLLMGGGLFILAGVNLGGGGATLAPLQMQIDSPSPSPSSADSNQPTPDPKGGAPASLAITPTAAGFVVASPTPGEVNFVGADRVTMVIKAVQRSWVRLTVDGAVQYEGIMRPETSLPTYEGQQITLRTSNAAGLEVLVNNQSLGVLGERGELFEQTFSLGNLTLAATPSPTATGETATEALPTIDTSRPEPIFAVPDAALTGEAQNLPTALPTFPLLITPTPTP
jgi:transcriptional regulator with XRE-family HTH domain